MDKEELYEKVIELMERVRELEQIIEDDRDDLDDTNKRLSDAEAENQSLKEENDRLREELSVCKDQEAEAKDYYDYLVANKKLLQDTLEENEELKGKLCKALADYQRAIMDQAIGASEPRRFLGAFLEENGVTPEECAELCGVHPTTIKRISKGYRCTNTTFDKVVHGLGLTAEQAGELRRSLTKKQKRYDRKK